METNYSEPQLAHQDSDGLNSTFDPKAVKIKDIDVGEPEWGGDSVTGHRTYHVMCECGGQPSKVIRRYTQFELLRKMLIMAHPECIIPVLPEKIMTEHLISDDSDHIRHRMTSFKRFLNGILDNEFLKRDNNFIKFMRNTKFMTDASSLDSNVLEEDTSTVSKYFKKFYQTVVGKISGSENLPTYVSKTETDFSFDKDYKKLRNLKDFMTKLFENTTSLSEVISKENENCRNIRSVISSLKISIKSIDVEQDYSIDQEINNMSLAEPEAKFEDVHSSSGLGESKDIIFSESNNDAEIHNLLEDMEGSIDILKAAVESVERRTQYKKAQETANQNLSTLAVNEDSKRQETLLKDKIKTLEDDLEKIDGNLKGEIDMTIKGIEEKTQKYIGKLVKIRKASFANSKEQWKKVYSASS